MKHNTLGTKSIPYSRLVAFQVLLTILARAISKNLAALGASLGSTVTPAILRHSKNHISIGQLLTGLIRGRATVV